MAVSRFLSLDPARFVDTAFRAAAGNLAGAVAWLPAHTRREARLAFLACRALDAYEDLSPDPASGRTAVRHAARYLAGHQTEPPPAGLLRARRRSDRLEKVVARRLPILKIELDHLPAPGRARVLALLKDVAEAMATATTSRPTRENLAAYGRGVLGRATRYAIELLGLRARWPVDVEGIGRVVQAANLLRDLPEARGSGPVLLHGDSHEALIRLFLEIAETAPMVPHGLAALLFAPISRARAAIAYLAATTARFFLARLGVDLPGWALSPARLAVACLLSSKSFSRFVVALQEAILQAIALTCLRLDVVRGAEGAIAAPAVLPASGRQQYDFESRLAARHPDPCCGLALARASQLAHTVLRLSGSLPGQPERGSEGPPSMLVMVSDYLLACGIRTITPLDPWALTKLGDLVSALALKASARDLIDDADGEVAAFLSAVVAAAAHASHESGGSGVEHRRIAQRLHRADYRSYYRGLERGFARPTPCLKHCLKHA